MAELPKLYIDNPGGDWLQSKLKQAQKDYQTAPSDTSTRKVGAANITGYFREDLDLSPDLLKDIPGALGEEDYRESGEKLNLIEESIQEEGYKPSPILVFVREDGQPFIIEGNHRVVEAVKSGRDTIPVELRYLRGAEDVEGPLSVERLRQFYESRPTETADEPRPSQLPALLGAASAASQLREPGEEPRPTGKGQMWHGVGKFMRGKMFPIITAVQQAWPYIPDEYKQNIGDAVDWLKETKTHELFGLDKSGLEYFKELMTPTPEEGIGTLPEFDEEGMAVAKKTFRSSGAVGGKAITPKYVSETSSEGQSVLNYGAGKPDVDIHSHALRKQGLEVSTHDFWSPNPEALAKKHDTVFASNVLNVQDSNKMFSATLDEITASVKPGGRAVMNLPRSPRKGAWSGKKADEDKLTSALKKRFEEVKIIRVGDNNIFEATYPKHRPSGAAETEAIPLPDLSPPPEESIGTLPEAAQRLVNAPSSVADEARQARREYDEIMGITKDFKPTFKEVPGEWFLVEGQAQFADGDVGDVNHDMIVREHVVRKLVDVIDANFDVDWEYWADKAESIGGGDDMTESPEGREILTRNVHKFLENKIKDASEGKDALLDKLGINEEELLIASGDPRSYPREYGIKHLGYVRVAGNNVEAYDITSKKLREIANGLWDAAGDESVERMTFDVEDAKTNTLYSDVPFSVLDSGNMRALREFRYYHSLWPGKASGGFVTLPEFAHGGFVEKPVFQGIGHFMKNPVQSLVMGV